MSVAELFEIIGLCLPNQRLLLALIVDLVFAGLLRSSLRENPRAS